MATVPDRAWARLKPRGRSQKAAAPIPFHPLSTSREASKRPLLSVKYKAVPKVCAQQVSLAGTGRSIGTLQLTSPLRLRRQRLDSEEVVACSGVPRNNRLVAGTVVGREHAAGTVRLTASAQRLAEGASSCCCIRTRSTGGGRVQIRLLRATTGPGLCGGRRTPCSYNKGCKLRAPVANTAITPHAAGAAHAVWRERRRTSG